MRDLAASVTETELAILRVLWEAGRATAPQITEAVYPSRTPSDYATVHSLLKRLEAKKVVARDRSTHPHGFTARVTESDIAGLQLQKLADRLSGGSLAPFIMHLVESRKLSKDEVAQIRSMLREYKAK